ncbi:MAG: helix-hairpin-helix domain-containing protein [Rubricoccaceae bacterium]
MKTNGYLLPAPSGPTNHELADLLAQMAALLVRRGEPNPYRVQAYVHAADLLRTLEEPVALAYARGGREALLALPGVGAGLATHLAQYIEAGRAALRDRLLEADDPAALIATVPGIGRALARRVVAELGVGSLAELERAAHDGRLEALAGFGPRRIEAIRLQLNSILDRAARRRARRVRRQILRLVAAQQRAAEAAERAQEAADLAAETAAGGAPDGAPLAATIYPLFPPAAA